MVRCLRLIINSYSSFQLPIPGILDNNSWVNANGNGSSKPSVMRTSLRLTFNMDKTIIVDAEVMSDRSTSDEEETAVVDKNSNKSAQHVRESKRSDNRRKERDSVDKTNTSLNASQRSNKSAEEVDNVEGTQTPEKTETNKSISSKTPGKKGSIFEFEDDGNDVFEKDNPTNMSADEIVERAKEAEGRRYSKTFDLKRKSAQRGTEDGNAQEGKKRRSKYTLRSSSNKRDSGDDEGTQDKATQSKKKSNKRDSGDVEETQDKATKSQRKSERPSTSKLVYETEHPDGSASETESDNGEESASELQRKARVEARMRSAHNKAILRIINHGTESQLKGLSRIGPKTATMLYQYR